MFSRLKGARPSPALVISLVALFVSLGGVGYAAVTITGKNVKNSSLTGKDVKNSSLTGSDVKNSSLTGSDVKNNKLTGSDVLESSLGKVPAASSADNANTVGGASASAFQPSSKQLRFGLIAMNPGDADRTIGKFGPFTLRAECDAGPDGQLTLTTSEDNSVADSDESSDNDFDSGEDFNASEGQDEDDEINAASPSGTAITGQLYTQEIGLGGGCHFWGEVTTTSG
jgi:hypothetical protein